MLEALNSLDSRLFLLLNGMHSDFWDAVMWQVSGKLQWIPLYVFLLGYLVYSLGNVLLADLMQFLLDALNESSDVAKGIISGLAYRLFDGSQMGQLEFARIAPLFFGKNGFDNPAK